MKSKLLTKIWVITDIISDYNGTLVGPGKKVSPKLITEINCWRKSGVNFSIMTGAPIKDIRNSLSVIYAKSETGDKSFSKYQKIVPLTHILKEGEILYCENGTSNIKQFYGVLEDEIKRTGGLKKENIENILKDLNETPYLDEISGKKFFLRDHIYNKLLDKFSNDGSFKKKFENYVQILKEDIYEKIRTNFFDKSEIESLLSGIESITKKNYFEKQSPESLADLFNVGFEDIGFERKIVFVQNGFQYGRFGYKLPTFQEAFEIAWEELQRATTHFKKINPEIHKTYVLTKTNDGFDWTNPKIDKIDIIRKHIEDHGKNPEKILCPTDSKNDPILELIKMGVNVTYVGIPKVLDDLKISINGVIKKEYKHLIKTAYGEGPNGTQRLLTKIRTEQQEYLKKIKEDPNHKKQLALEGFLENS